MNRCYPLFILFGGLLLLLMHSCGDISPVWKGAAKLDTLTLYFSEPLEFDIRFNHPEPELETMLELAITYDQGINLGSLPLFLTIEDEETHTVREFSIEVPLREEGQWLGYPEENGVDMTVSYIAIQELTLKSDQTYQLKIFANDEESEKIYGIIEVVARLYPQVQEEEE